MNKLHYKQESFTDIDEALAFYKNMANVYEDVIMERIYFNYISSKPSLWVVKYRFPLAE